MQKVYSYVFLQTFWIYLNLGQFLYIYDQMQLIINVQTCFVQPWVFCYRYYRHNMPELLLKVFTFWVPCCYGFENQVNLLCIKIAY